MAERFKAAVLKTVERKLRGFESLSLRHLKRIGNFKRSIYYLQAGKEVKWRGGRAAEGSCLLSSCGGDSTPGSNPGLSAIFIMSATEHGILSGIAPVS